MKSGVGASDEGHRLAETKYSVQGNGLHDQSEGASAYDASSQWLSSFQPPRRPLSVSSRSLRAKSGEILREKVGFQTHSLQLSNRADIREFQRRDEKRDYLSAATL